MYFVRGLKHNITAGTTVMIMTTTTTIKTTTTIPIMNTITDTRKQKMVKGVPPRAGLERLWL